MKLFKNSLKKAAETLRKSLVHLKKAHEWASTELRPRVKRLWKVLRVVLPALMCIYPDVFRIEAVERTLWWLDILLL